MQSPVKCPSNWPYSQLFTAGYIQREPGNDLERKTDHEIDHDRPINCNHIHNQNNANTYMNAACYEQIIKCQNRWQFESLYALL